MHRRRIFIGAALTVAVSSFTTSAQTQNATLLVRTDAECRWSIDGEAKGVLKVDDRVRVSLQLGEHLIEAVDTSSGTRWERVVKLTEPTMQVFTIPFQAAKADSELAARGYWVDPDTRLMWAAKDNGYDVNWNQASTYCQNLRVGRYGGWGLPTIDELQGLRSGTSPKGGIKATGFAWSSTAGERSGEAWAFYFGLGFRDSDAVGYSSHRALCVRRAGE